MKSVAEYILSPLGLVFLFLIIGNFLLFIKRYWKFGRYLVLTGLFLLFIFSFGPIVNLLFDQLEYRYPPIMAEKAAQFDTIVLLTGGADRNPSLPISSQVNRSSIFRLCEAIRLLQLNPRANLLIAGGGPSSLRSDLAESSVIADLATSLGVPRKKIICETDSQNTYENALYVQKYVGTKPFVLVTSAMHMPRAMSAFRGLGMKPIPAPTDYRIMRGNPLDLKPQSDSFNSWVRNWVTEFPSVQDLEDFTEGVHECLGLLWYRMADVRGFNDKHP